MTCEICKRGSCTRSFHSLEEQERFDNGVDGLDDEIESLRAQLTTLQAKLAEAEKDAPDAQRYRAMREDAIASGDYLCAEEFDDVYDEALAHARLQNGKE